MELDVLHDVPSYNMYQNTNDKTYVPHTTYYTQHTLGAELSNPTLQRELDTICRIIYDILVVLHTIYDMLFVLHTMYHTRHTKVYVLYAINCALYTVCCVLYAVYCILIY